MGSGVIGPASPSACRRIQSPHRPRTSNCPVRGLSRACRTQRRLHGDIEISIVGLQHADRYISVVNTDTAQWSRSDLLCLVAGLGVVAVEERALLGSCDRRTAVGRRDYAVIITLLWLGRRAGPHRRERAHRRQRHKNNDRFDSKRAMMPRSVSHDRQRSAGILSRRSSPNSTGCPDPTSAAVRKQLAASTIGNSGPSGTRAVTRPLDRTGAVRHHWSQTDHHIVCWCHTVSGCQLVSPAPACGRAQRAALAIDTSSSHSLGSVDNRCTDNTCPRAAVLRLRARHDVTQKPRTLRRVHRRVAFETISIQTSPGTFGFVGAEQSPSSGELTR